MVKLQSVEENDFGPKMQALTNLQRGFVLAKLQNPNGTDIEAALAAGVTGKTAASVRTSAHYLSHNPKVLEAIKEQAERMLHSGAILAAGVIIEIATDPMHKDRLKAADRLLGMAGLGIVTEHRVTVTHQSDAEKIAEIKKLTERLGFDKTQTRALLGSAGVVDAEFVEVAPATAALDAEWSV